MKEVKKVDSKSVEPTASLSDPTRFPAGIKANGGKQNDSRVTKDTESNHETLRHGSKPQPEAVSVAAKEDPSCLAKARKYAVRSEHGGAEPMAVTGTQGV